MPRVLVTGFEAFADLETNPSAEAVRHLRRRALPEVATAILPVTWEGAVKLLRAHAAHARIDRCLMLGVARRATTLRVERQALNGTNAMADNAGIVRAGRPLSETQPLESGAGPDPAWFARWVDALTAAGVAYELSDDAGRYLCNALYWSAVTGPAPWAQQSVFVHVPPCPDEEAQARLNAQVEAAVLCYRDLDAAPHCKGKG